MQILSYYLFKVSVAGVLKGPFAPLYISPWIGAAYKLLVILQGVVTIPHKFTKIKNEEIQFTPEQSNVSMKCPSKTCDLHSLTCVICALPRLEGVGMNT